MYQVSGFSKYKLSLDQQLNQMWFANVVSPVMQVSPKATIPFM
jgi:hypothetical protein